MYVTMYITYAFVLLLSLCACANVISNSAPVICKLADKKCTAENGQAFYLHVLQKNSETGTEDLDPMHHEVIDGKLSIVTYKLTNTSFEGFKKCKVDIFEFNSTTLTVHVILLCPALKMHGVYDMHGKLTQALPIEGNGEYDLQTNEYRVNVNVALEIVKGSDAKNFVVAKLYSVKAEALGPIAFNFQNLFNGQKDLAETVHKFANENWKEVSDDLQGPAFDAHFRKIINNLNKIFKRIPAEIII